MANRNEYRQLEKKMKYAILCLTLSIIVAALVVSYFERQTFMRILYMLFFGVFSCNAFLLYLQETMRSFFSSGKNTVMTIDGFEAEIVKESCESWAFWFYLSISRLGNFWIALVSAVLFGVFFIIVHIVSLG